MRSARDDARWDGEIEPVYSGINGDEDLTPRNILRQRQRMNAVANFDTCKGNPKCMVFSVRSCVCGGKIEFHADNRAVCDKCQTVFNDGGNTEGRVVTTLNYSDGRKEVLPIMGLAKRETQDMNRIMRVVA